ncbi:hypothetical protein HD806DRAFT_90033 [Xylariaceae sp. AK1471]|nr:hypothetical protein HD806DRAFT_90033 [Xylariaceae sp. AK1471]
MSQSRDNSNRSESTPDSHQQEAHQVPSASKTQAEMAQAFKDLARGEQQAAAIEANLTNLESKLDALLASIEAGSAENGDKDEDSKEQQLPGEK